MPDIELHADAIVYMFGHLFAEEWVDRKTDPVFGRARPDARARLAPVASKALSEKSLGEEILYATLARLILDERVTWEVHSEKGWNFDVYDRVYLAKQADFPSTPLHDALALTFERAGRSILQHKRKRFEERGLAVDALCTGLRKLRWVRADPYQFVCGAVERHLMDLGLYRTERQRVAGPFLAPVLLPDAEKMAAYEFLALRLQKDIEKLEMEEPLMTEALRDNVLRSMLKMRSDEEYIKERYGDEGSPLDAILGREDDVEDDLGPDPTVRK